MKKVIISLFVSLFIVSGLGTEVFADTYVPSIEVRDEVSVDGGTSGKPNELVLKKDKDGTPTDVVIVTPYKNYEDIIDTTSQNEIIQAYTEIKNAKSVYDLNYDIGTYCNECFKQENLIIRDLFDITPYSVENGVYTKDLESYKDTEFYKTINGKKYFVITITIEEMENFVCVLHYQYNATEKKYKFEVVDEAYILKDNCHIYIALDGFSPFAIVTVTKKTCSVDGTDDTPVSERGDYTAPKTGVTATAENNYNWYCFAIAAFAIIAFSVVIRRKKYINNNEKK